MGKFSKILAVVGSLGVLAAPFAGTPAFAQAGSTGGTIGKTNKSVGGGEGATPAPRARSHATAPKPRTRSHATERASVEPRSGGRSGSADGTWVVSARPDCLPSWTLTVAVRNSVISAASGRSATRQDSRGGAVRGNANVLGFQFDFVGHFRGGQASGTLFNNAHGCQGHWTAMKS